MTSNYHPQKMQCGSRTLDLNHPKVMGILNITPDSFYDGGVLFDESRPSLDRILAQAEKMVDEGAAILDIGAESTRPGAVPVTEQEERDRLLPVIEAVNSRLDVILSIDTSSPALMREGAALGVGLLNDVRALMREGALAAAAESGLPVCLMHMLGQPKNMQAEPKYSDVTQEVIGFLSDRIDACVAAGISRDRLLLDPGFGFGKTVQHNLQLLRELDQLVALGMPVLVGLSRKSLIGALLGRDVEERLPGSLALATLAVANGASIVRTHDVAATWDAVRLAQAVTQEVAG